jgi:hypothetical protein
VDNNALTYTIRARAAQLLTWLTSVQQQERQQHIVQADRLTNDGADRGMDDPDNRRQQQMQAQNQANTQNTAQFWAGRSFGYDGADDVHMPREIGPAAGSAGAALNEARFEANRARQEHEEARHERIQAQGRLAAQVEAIQHRLQVQQQATRQHGRGQGRGW